MDGATPKSPTPPPALAGQASITPQGTGLSPRRRLSHTRDIALLAVVSLITPPEVGVSPGLAQGVGLSPTRIPQSSPLGTGLRPRRRPQSRPLGTGEGSRGTRGPWSCHKPIPSLAGSGPGAGEAPRGQPPEAITHLPPRALPDWGVGDEIGGGEKGGRGWGRGERGSGIDRLLVLAAQ